MNAPDPLGFAADVDHDDDVDDDDDVEHVWESREVRWSALAGLLLVVGFVAGRFDAPDIAVTGLYWPRRWRGCASSRSRRSPSWCANG